MPTFEGPATSSAWRLFRSRTSHLHLTEIIVVDEPLYCLVILIDFNVVFNAPWPRN